MSLTNLDAGPFKVGDRVAVVVDSSEGEQGTVIGRDRTWVRVRMDSETDDVRYCSPSDLVNLSQRDSEDTNAKTVTRVVAVFYSLGAQELEKVFDDAREADVWIAYLRNAPGVTTVTVTRDLTETFICNNA